MTRVLRYLAPNLITLSSMIFGLVSLWSSHNGDPALAAWMIIYAVLTDRIDGLVARALKATSELGMQLDSFADTSVVDAGQSEVTHEPSDHEKASADG